MELGKSYHLGRLVSFTWVLWQLFFLLPGIAAESAYPAEKTIAVLSDGAAAPLKDITLRFQKALEILSQGEFTPVFKSRPIYCAHFEKDQARKALRSVVSDSSVDLVFVNGPLMTAQALQMAKNGKKPMVGVLTLDPALVLAGPSGRTQLMAFSVVPDQVYADLKTMARMFKARKLHILVDAVVINGFPDLQKNLKKTAARYGFIPTINPVYETAEKTLQNPQSPDAVVYLMPTVQMPDGERKILIKRLNDKGAFVFSGAGIQDVQNGALAAQRPLLHERLARHAALNAVRLFSGRRMPEALDPLKPRQRLMINEKTAVAVGYHVSQKVAEEAREMEPEPEEKSVVAALPEMDRLPFAHHLKKSGAPFLSLTQAVNKALKHNASLSVKAAQVEEDRQDRDRLMTELFPQIEGHVGYARVDENTAQRSFEATPLQQSTAGVALKQLIFSDPVISRLRAADKSVESALFKERSRRLDVAARVQDRYIDCLSAAALYWIREYNLKLTGQNLETARQRHAAGTAGPQQVYRWQVQEAQDRSELLGARSTLEQSLVALNRIMGVKQHQIWSFEYLRPEKMTGIFNPGTFNLLILNAADFNTLNGFVIDKALSSSPELQSIDRLIDASRIVRGYYQRRFYTPEASMNFGYRHILDQTYDNAPSPWDINDFIPSDTDNHWAFEVKLVWSLLDGGGKVVDLRKNRATLRRLESLHRQAVEIIEERARDGLIRASTARSDMNLARIAAEAAKKNYKVNRDGYAQGTSTILDLLDAQREARVQERRAVLSGYRFLKAVVEVERAMNRIAALVPEKEQNAWWEELKGRLSKKD